MKWSPIFAVLAILVTFSACSDIQNAPKIIDADGTLYMACKGFITISGNLQQGYEMSAGSTR
jgi:hypothetical protein